MNLRGLKELIRAGDLDGVRAALEANLDLVWTSDPDPEQWDEKTALHSAARHAQLDICKLLVERGAEVYSNPMNSYPPVYVADSNRYFRNRPDAQHVVDYFLREIPEKANGTNKLGATINIAAREGWTEIVRRHIEIDSLSVFQRGWIGDSPLHWRVRSANRPFILSA